MFVNTLALDLSKDFYPFGEKPRFNDTLYLASQEVLAKGNADPVTIDIGLSDPPPTKINASEDLVIAWEIWNGQTWQELGRSTKNAPVSGASAFKFSDGTKAFTQSGQVTFTLPATLAPGVVNGETNYWLRARIAKGNYGTEATYREAKDAQGNTIYLPVMASFGPPSVAKVRLGYTYRREGALSRCFAYNDFNTVDCTARANQANAPFYPFEPPMDADPTLYLGFVRPFANRTVNLFALIQPPLYGERTGDGSVASGLARVSWDYATSSGWQPLRVQDETDAFTKPGLITFIGPKDLAKRPQFGQSHYWLRARWHEGSYAAPPSVRRVLTNTTWASHVTTLRNEVLGSSTGEPGQVFITARKPVLLGPQIEVREPALPSDAERPIIEREEGKNAIATTGDIGGQPQAQDAGVWVRWHQVPDFYASGPRDRHYVLDPLTGEVRFGDGSPGDDAPPGTQQRTRSDLPHRRR